MLNKSSKPLARKSILADDLNWLNDVEGRSKEISNNLGITPISFEDQLQSALKDAHNSGDAKSSFDEELSKIGISRDKDGYKISNRSKFLDFLDSKYGEDNVPEKDLSVIRNLTKNAAALDSQDIPNEIPWEISPKEKSYNQSTSRGEDVRKKKKKIKGKKIAKNDTLGHEDIDSIDQEDNEKFRSRRKKIEDENEFMVIR